jgi:type VI secretion system protein ImpF
VHRPVRTEIERTAQPSLLDRLTDHAPGVSADPATTREASTRAFRDSVQRDVEWLLNTRRTIVAVPPYFPEVRRSVHEYGLPDTTGIPVATPEGQAQLLAALQDTLERFEPRLARPRVRFAAPVEATGGRTPHIRFVVEATLMMDPSPEQVVFDTVLEVASGEYEVNEGGGGVAPPAPGN